MNTTSHSFHILVNGKPITEYLHEGNTFIEGRKNSEFELQITNHTATRVLAIPSVDGLDTLEGKPASSTSKGYVLGAYKTIKVPGWTLDNNAVAKFIFKSKDQSYADFASPTKTQNVGVIGLLLYAEKVVVAHWPARSLTYTSPTVKMPIANIWPNYNDWIGTTVSDTTTRAVYQNCICSNATQQATTETPFSLGTGFGDKAKFEVMNVPFERGNLIGQSVMYYDTKKNLAKRGIIMNPEPVVKLPEAFPGIGCKRPPGYQG